MIELLWNHSSSWGPVFVDKQIFASWWGHYFLGKLYDVTSEDEYNVYYYELSFLRFIRKDNSIWFGGEVKSSKVFMSVLDCKNNDSS